MILLKNLKRNYKKARHSKVYDINASILHGQENLF